MISLITSSTTDPRCLPENMTVITRSVNSQFHHKHSIHRLLYSQQTNAISVDKRFKRQSRMDNPEMWATPWQWAIKDGQSRDVGNTMTMGNQGWTIQRYGQHHDNGQSMMDNPEMWTTPWQWAINDGQSRDVGNTMTMHCSMKTAQKRITVTIVLICICI